MIKVENLTIKKGDFELKEVSFSLGDNENLLISGSSESGKTLLASALAGNIFVGKSISIHYNSDGILPEKTVFVTQRQPIKNRSNVIDGYYQQRYNSFDSEDSYTVFEELSAVCEEESKIIKHLEDLDALYLKDRPLLQLSSGEHKRFQLVKALLTPCQILILDEPFLGLDVTSREKLNQLISCLSSQNCQIILISQHEIPDWITHVLELGNGRQIAFEPKENFRLKSALPEKISFNLASIPFQQKNQIFENAVLMKNVSVKYGDHEIFKNLDWKVKKGDRWLLKGKNGAGKSTLISLIVGDNPQAYSKEIYLFDRRRGTGESIWDIKRKIGYISPELFAFFDKSITCFNTVASGFFDTEGVYKKLTVQEKELSAKWLEVFHLEKIADQPLSAVGSGTQRLLMLIRALVKNPPLLIFDEPC